MTITAIPVEAPTESTTNVPHQGAAGAHSALLCKAVNADALEKLPCEMKWTIGRDDLLKVLTLVMKVGSSHVLVATHRAALEGVCAQAVFTCSTPEIAVSWYCDAEVEREGAFAIPVKPFFECVKTFSKGKRITMEVVELLVQIASGKRVFTLKGGKDKSSVSTWSEMVLGEGTPFALDTDILRQAIKEVQFSAAEDDSRPVLTNVYTHIQEETLTLVTLDGFRLAVRTIALPTKIARRDATVLVPVASLRILAEVMPEAVPVVVTWDQDKTQAVFQAGRVEVWTRLGEGTFPNYSKMIPKELPASFTTPRHDLDQIVKAFKPFALDNANLFTLTYNAEEGTVGCLAESEDLGEAYDEINVPVEGSDGQIILNIRFLIDVLTHVPVDEFVFKLTASDTPGVITPRGRQDYVLVVMPIIRNHSHRSR